MKALWFSTILSTLMLSASAHDLSLQDIIVRDWSNETITRELPGAKGEGVSRCRDGQAIPGQVVATDDGVRGLFVVDRLAKDGATTVTADLGQIVYSPYPLRLGAVTPGLHHLEITVFGHRYNAFDSVLKQAGTAYPLKAMGVAAAPQLEEEIH